MTGYDDSARRTAIRRVSVDKVNDGGSQQFVDASGFYGDSPRQMVRVQNHGFSSNPPVGSEGLALALGGRSDRLHVLGLEHQQYKPTGLNPGEVMLYDASGQAMSLVKKAIRIVGNQSITLVAPKIILDGAVYLGGADASKPAAMLGSVDSAGDTEQSNLATKVFVK